MQSLVATITTEILLGYTESKTEDKQRKKETEREREREREEEERARGVNCGNLYSAHNETRLYEGAASERGRV